MPEVGIHLIPFGLGSGHTKKAFPFHFFFSTHLDLFFLARLGGIAESVPFRTPERAKPINKKIDSTNNRRERDSNPR